MIEKGAEVTKKRNTLKNKEIMISMIKIAKLIEIDRILQRPNKINIVKEKDNQIEIKKETNIIKIGRKLNREKRQTGIGIGIGIRKNNDKEINPKIVKNKKIGKKVEKEKEKEKGIK